MPAEMNATNNRLLEKLRLAVLGSFYSFVLFFLVLSLSALDSIRLSTGVIWLLQILPLLPFAPGLHRGDSRHSMWLSLVVLLYFIHAVLVAFDPARRVEGGFEIFFSVVLFSALMAYIRTARQAAKA